MYRKTGALALLAALVVWGMGGCQEPPEDEDTEWCFPLSCVVDGFCDAEACETRWNCPDCSPVCDPARVTSAPREYLVTSYVSSLPDHSEGVDLDGDGDRDNKWNSISSLVNEHTHNDLDEEIRHDIWAGHLLIAARVYGDYPGEHEDLSLVQLLMAEVHDATPQLDGQDTVRLAPGASVDVGMCGRNSEQLYGRPEWSKPLRFPVPWPGPGGTALVDLYSYYIEGDVTAAQWQGIHVGGGIERSQVYAELLPRLVDLINHTIASAPGSEETNMLVQLFDGNCARIEDVPECELVLPGRWECEDDEDPPVITWTEIACNPLIDSVLQPDFDSDGDGVDDLISFGARLRAVPVTIVE